MTKRNIVIIDEEKCDGCGQCVTACAEGAIQIINGKAKLVSEVYCDGLGACLGHCPKDAITVEQRDAAEFDEEAAKKHVEQLARDNRKTVEQTEAFSGCPGVAAMSFDVDKTVDEGQGVMAGDTSSQLRQWPVQLSLLSPQAAYFHKADLVLAADCAAFAMGDFHETILKDKAVAIACPKLDECGPYIEKLAQIIKLNDLNSLTVVHMEVPCCSGLLAVTREAIKQSGVQLAYKDIKVSLKGQILAEMIVEPD